MGQQTQEINRYLKIIKKQIQMISKTESKLEKNIVTQDQKYKEEMEKTLFALKSMEKKWKNARKENQQLKQVSQEQIKQKKYIIQQFEEMKRKNKTTTATAVVVVTPTTTT